MHLELACYGSPIKHKKFIEDVNNWQYELEGNIRTGKCRPFISEIKLYDVRIKEELAPQFLKDIGACQPIGAHYTKSKLKQKFIDLVIKFLKKLLNNVEVEPSSEPKKHSLPDWFYVFNIVNFKDPYQEDPITKEKKEVL